jgi:leucyl/phenylalanyl-tRNA--protein transferase
MGTTPGDGRELGEIVSRLGMRNLIRVPGDGDVLAVGGELECDSLLQMYRCGIFPWYEEGSPIIWWSPDPRGILELDALHVPRRLARTLRSARFRVTFDRCFAAVIRACGATRRGDTWLTPEMVATYCELHERGFAHSAEVWREGILVGGIYGVALGGFFAGESMFHSERDASKVALVALVERLRRRGFQLFDLQVLNEHTSKLGGTEIPRRRYLDRLAQALAADVTF